MKHRTKQKGFTLIELLVVMSIIALLLSILMPALGRARAEAILTKDQSQVKSVYAGFSFWAPSHNGNYPIPGLEERLESPINSGNYIKGRGGEDLLRNDHASMLAMCVMQGLFTTDLLVAPNEQSDYVYPMENYDYEAYSVPDWTFWDRDFGNDLTNEDPERECHNSYGVIPITGKRKHQNWGVSTHNPTGFAIVGTRGPEGGTYVDNEYSNSYLLHGIDKDWKGIVSFGDGHTDILETFYPLSSTFIDDIGVSLPDNIFLEDADQAQDNDYGNELGENADIVLTHVKVDDVNATNKGGGCDSFLYD